MAGGTGRIRDADSLVRPAVSETLRNLADGAGDARESQDAAARALAVRYAAQIDEAAVIAADLAELEPEDFDQAERIRRLARRVEAQTVLAELGPKLLAVLESLGATPKGRAALGQRPAAGTGGKLAKMRAAQ